MAEILNFGDLVIARQQKRHILAKDECAHKNVEMEPNGEIVTCKDCSKQLSSYWVLGRIVDQWEQHAAKIERARLQLVEDKSAHIHLIAAKLVEKAWRSRTMAPACPHCHRGILPEDGFGRGAVSREMELRRRDVEKQAKVAP